MNFEEMMPEDPWETTSKGTCRAVILSPIDAPAALSAGLQMVGSSAPVIGTSRGSAVYMESQQDASEEDELAQLLGEDRPIPADVDKMASLISKMSAGGSVALTSWTSEESAEGLTGTIVARRYVNGKPEQKLSSGIVLAGIDPVCEELLLGRLSPEEAQESSRHGKWTGWMRGPGFRP